jgi:hypothetical protein
MPYSKVHRSAPYNGKGLKHNGPYNKMEPVGPGTYCPPRQPTHSDPSYIDFSGVL